MKNSKNGKVKRPERPLYIPPVFRSKSDEEYMKMEYAENKYVNGNSNYSFENCDPLLEKPKNKVSKKVRFNISDSSSNSKNTSDESYNDDDSSDFEDCCCDFVPEGDLNISEETNENNSNDHWMTEERMPARNHHGIEIENYQKDDKISSEILMQPESNLGVKSYSNQLKNPDSNETNLGKRLFDNNDDSIWNIEFINDCNTKREGGLTSSPNSDIAQEKVLDVDKYAPGEDNILESTLLSQNDKHETITSGKKNFDVYHDLPSTENQPPDYTEIFGNNYIPPPVPPPVPGFRLPPVHRIPSLVSSPYELFVPRRAAPQYMPRCHTQIRSRHMFVPSIRLYPDIRHLPASFGSSYMPSVRHHVLTSSFSTPPTEPRMFSTLSPIFLQQERIISQRISQDAIFSPRLNQQNLSPHSLETYKEEESFYIPPPISPPQQIDGCQQIQNPNLLENAQSCLPSSSSLINKMVFDTKIWPQSLKMEK